MSDVSYSILVVDDSEDYRNLVCHYLSDFPCTISQAQDGEDAVELFARGQFDLVIMDIIMPLMDGVDAIAAIRENESQRDVAPTPILALSGEKSAETGRDCIKAGSNTILIKPVSRQELVGTVCSLVGCELPL